MARLLAALATLIAVCLVAPVQAASAEPADPDSCMYDETCIPTSVVIEVEAEYRPGEEVTITYEVRANSEAGGPIEGTLDVVVEGGAGAGAGAGGEANDRVLARQVHGQSYDYADAPITVDLGRLPVGDYETTAQFTPSEGSVYGPSNGAAEFTVTPAAGPPNARSGILPDTGGPGLWWLLLALGLVSGGAGAVYYGRRRSLST